MWQSSRAHSDEVLDLVITGALVMDPVVGIVKVMVGGHSGVHSPGCVEGRYRDQARADRRDW